MTDAETASDSVAKIFRLAQLMSGHAIPRALTTAAQLRLDEHLSDGPRDAAALAAATGTDADTLYRLLRALAAAGIFIEHRDGRFELAPMGHYLRFARSGMVGDEAHRAWDNLLYTLQTAQPAFDHVYGMSFYDYLTQRPETSANFNEFMTATSGSWLKAAVAACDLTGAGTVVDVGGGQGGFLAELLGINPGLRGILLDLPEAVADAPAVLSAAGVADRCTIVGGSFLEAVPEGGDVYTLARVLFNWDNAHAAIILRNIRRVIPDGGRLLVVESLIEPLGNRNRFMGAINDLNALLLMGGRHHTEAEFRELFAATGFAFQSCETPDKFWYVIEGRPI
jgi:ubiquinone/menaquinone biosynthesis C-methylase UbiE